MNNKQPVDINHLQQVSVKYVEQHDFLSNLMVRNITTGYLVALVENLMFQCVLNSLL